MVGAGGFGFGVNVDSGLGVRTDGRGGGYIRGGYGYVGLSKWEDTVSNITLYIEHNDPLSYSPGLELHHPTISTLGAHGEQLERRRSCCTLFACAPCSIVVSALGLLRVSFLRSELIICIFTFV